MYTLYHHGRGVGDVISGKADLFFDKTSMSPVFQAKDGISGYVSRKVSGNVGTAKGGAIFLNSDTELGKFGGAGNVSLFSREHPDFWSEDWMKAKARADLSLFAAPRNAAILHEGTHIMQQRLMGSPLVGNKTNKFAWRSFMKSHTSAHYFMGPFEKEAVYRTYKILFGR
ncbi:hypothetical protein [Lunatimonas salinarum]|uniref:hypothetical protein n=1 Tax=Lunatimonas salinarum TaxID=1774590 RepID=UPI001AE095F4|nr:hypothetical protein [Lunatimonas salinarum]